MSNIGNKVDGTKPISSEIIDELDYSNINYKLFSSLLKEVLHNRIPIVFGTAGEIDSKSFKQFENLFYNPLNNKYMNMRVQVFNKSNNPLPTYATVGSAGIDLVASINGIDRQIVYPGKIALVHTGLYVAIPEGYELQIRPRSGLALKKGITVLNTPGTIDEDYRGEIGVIIINHGDEAVAFANGDKIAQAVLKKVDKIEWESVPYLDQLPSTNRGEGGFGSTGINNK